MLSDKIVEAVLEDWQTAPISEPLRLILGFLEKLTLSPDQLTAVDLQPLLEAGLREEAIEDAIHVCAVFNIIDRIADALDFEVPPRQDFHKVAKLLLKRGYR